VYFVVNAASVIWPMLTASLVWNVGLIWVFAIGLLSLPLIWSLLISKKFSTEFSALRNTEPKYKETLRTVMWIALAVTMIIATFFDIVKLASG
jgi:dipeptide/tripeptide permease